MEKEELIARLTANNLLLNAVVQEIYLDKAIDIKTRDYYGSNITEVRKNYEQIIKKFIGDE